MASPDPPTTAATAAATATANATASTTAATRNFATPPPLPQPLPLVTGDPKGAVPAAQPSHLHHHQHPPPYSTIRVPNPQLPKPHDPTQGILYPVASSGRGFIPRPLRPQSDHNTVTVANPGASFPSRSSATAVTFAHQARPFGFPQSDFNHPVHSMRMPHLHPSHMGVIAVPGSAPIKGIPVSAHPKVAPSQPSVSDCNGYKDSRERMRDDTSVTVRDRKVRILDGASIYSLCRSWLRNGFSEERQPQHYDSTKSLPRPLPIPNLLKKKEDDDEEVEDEGSVETLSAQDLLHRHVKRAKKIRERLREQRLKRIARYKTRLALLLPPPVEQFRTDVGSGN